MECSHYKNFPAQSRDQPQHILNHGSSRGPRWPRTIPKVRRQREWLRFISQRSSNFYRGMQYYGPSVEWMMPMFILTNPSEGGLNHSIECKFANSWEMVDKWFQSAYPRAHSIAGSTRYCISPLSVITDTVQSFSTLCACTLVPVQY